MATGTGCWPTSAPPAPPCIHVADTARLTLPVLDTPPGLTIVVDDRTLGS